MADPAGDADTLSEIAYQDEIKKTKKSLEKKKKSLVFSCVGCPLDSEREGFESSPKSARCWVRYSDTVGEASGPWVFDTKYSLV